MLILVLLWDQSLNVYWFRDLTNARDKLQSWQKGHDESLHKGNQMINATASLYCWDDIPRERLNAHLSRKLITGENVMVAHVYLDKGGVVPAHSHHNEQITYILSGALRFLLGEDQDEEIIVRAGEVLVIPSFLVHSAEALAGTLDVDIFSPPREDWLDGSDAYLRESKPVGGQ
jgi:quercetin dioxygenase-like cupin family protein